MIARVLYAAVLMPSCRLSGGWRGRTALEQLRCCCRRHPPHAGLPLNLTLLSTLPPGGFPGSSNLTVNVPRSAPPNASQVRTALAAP